MPPSSASRALIVGSDKAGVDLLVEPIDDLGEVFFGAPIAEPGSRLKSGHVSATVGKSGSVRARRSCDRERSQLAGLDVLDYGGHDANMTSTCPPSRSVSAGPAPRYGTCTMSTPVIILNSSPPTWIEVPLPADAMLTLPGLCLGIGDEFGNGLGRNRRIDRHDEGLAHDACDRRDVADEIEIELLVERRVDRARRIGQEERVAVGDARTTASVPMLPPAPGRFSTTNGWPSRSESH